MNIQTKTDVPAPADIIEILESEKPKSESHSQKDVMLWHTNWRGGFDDYWKNKIFGN